MAYFASDLDAKSRPREINRVALRSPKRLRRRLAKSASGGPLDMEKKRGRDVALQLVSVDTNALLKPGRRKEWPRFGTRPTISCRTKFNGPKRAHNTLGPVVSKVQQLQSLARSKLRRDFWDSAPVRYDVDYNAGNAVLRELCLRAPKKGAIRS